MPTQIILQPCGNNDSRKHYIDTIDNPVPLDLLVEYLDEATASVIREVGGAAGVPVWGVTPGKTGGNAGKWERIQTGDVALFSRDGGVVSSAVVVLQTRNEPLAEKLWGRDAAGQTWEYMYFLDEVREQRIPYSAFNAAAGYEPNYVIQGFNVLRFDKSRSVIDRFGLNSDTYFPDVPERDFTDAVNSLGDGPLDVSSTVKLRTEQGFLRRHLFKNRHSGRCAFCGEELPVGFLVAAHIKKRSECSNEEKLDYKNIVMPMCKLGCDELYERGYLGVQDGKIIRIAKGPTTERLEAMLSGVLGRECSSWTEGSAKYFEAHQRRHSAG